jgi:hypothetical protein
MEGPELELFRRGVRHATDGCTGDRLDGALDDLGWEDALGEDAPAAVSVLFECQGSSNASSSALGRVLGHALGLGGAAGAPLVVLPPLGSCDPPGRVVGSTCAAGGLTVGGAASVETAVVVAGRGDERRALALPAGALTWRAVGGIDPELALREVSGEVPLEATEPLGDAAWDHALALGQLAVGHELLGAARAMLELARRHALEREQFGRPIGAFQAVRHRLAEALVWAEAAASLLDASWEDPAAYGAMAKAFAGSAARLAARHAQQVIAGIGFTTEHPLHRYVRRTIVLDQMLGAGTTLTRRLGAEVLATATLPPAVPL